MKRKKLKIKWKNVVKLIVFIFCISMIFHDLFMLTIGSWISGNLYSWTWFGFITFLLFCSIACMIYADFEEQIEKTQATRNS